MINKKLNKLMGIQSIIVSLLYIISNIFIKYLNFLNINYEIIKDYLAITYSFLLLIIVLIISCYMRYNRRKIKPFSLKTGISFILMLLSLYIVIVSNNILYSSQISSIILLISGIVIISEEK